MALKCFDVVRPDRREDLLLIYQSDFLSHLDSRLVIPLLQMTSAVSAVARLNPILEIEGDRYALWTQSSFAANLRDLGRFHASLAHERDRIRDAFNFLTTGF